MSITGIGVSPGSAHGPAVVVSTVKITPPGERTDDPAAATEAVTAALGAVAAEMEVRSLTGYGADDLAACRQFFLDWGLSLAEEQADRLVFETLNGCRVIVAATNHPDLPPAIAVIGDDDATAGAGDRHLELALPQRPRPLQGGQLTLFGAHADNGAGSFGLDALLDLACLLNCLELGIHYCFFVVFLFVGFNSIIDTFNIDINCLCRR